MERSARTESGMVPDGGGAERNLGAGPWGVDGEGRLDDDDGDGDNRKAVSGGGFKKFAVEEGELSSEMM